MNEPALEHLLERVLPDSDAMVRLPDEAWDLLIRQARSAALLGHLAATLADAGQLERVPSGRRQRERAPLLQACTGPLCPSRDCRTFMCSNPSTSCCTAQRICSMRASSTRASAAWWTSISC